MAEDARAFLQQHDLPALLPWLDHARGGAAPAGLEPEVAGQLRRLLRLHIVKSLKPESKAAQKAAAQEVVAGLASWLPRALAAGQLPDSLNGLLDVLKEQRCWAHLDVLAAACVELFDGHEEERLEKLGACEGIWRLPQALLAAAQRRLDAGHIAGALGLLQLGQENAAPGHVLAELCTAVCNKLSDASSSAFMADLAQGRGQTLGALLCRHAGADRAAHLLATLPRHDACPPAFVGLAMAVVQHQRGDVAGLFAGVPGFRGALSAVVAHLAAALETGRLPERDPCRPVPEQVVQAFESYVRQPDTTSQAVAAFMRSRSKDTVPCIRLKSGDAQANHERAELLLGGFMRSCPSARQFLRYHVCMVGGAAAKGRGKHKGQAQVAGIYLAKEEKWWTEARDAHRASKQHKEQLQAALAAAPEAMEVEPSQRAAAADEAAEAAAAKRQAEAAATAKREAEAAAAAKQAAEEAAAAKREAEEAAAAKRAAEAAAAAKRETEAAAAAKQAAEAAAAAKQAAEAAAAAKRAAEAAAAAKREAEAAAVAKREAEEAAAATQAAEEAAAAQRATALEVQAASPAASQMGGADVDMLPSGSCQPPADTAAVQASPAAIPAAAQAAAAVLLAARTPGGASVTPGTGGRGRALVQQRLSLEGRPYSPQPAAQQPQESGGRGASLAAPQSTAQSGGSTAKKRAAPGSAARRGGGPGSRNRAALAKTAERLKLRTLISFWEPVNQHLTREECEAAERRAAVSPQALSFDGEAAVDGPAAAAVARAKRSRRSD